MSSKSLNSLIDVTMIEGLGYLPKPFQQQVLSHILSMVDDNAQAFPLDDSAPQTSNINTSNITTSPTSNSSIHCCNRPQPVLIVHGTGGGKSSIYQTIGFVKGGTHLIIQNTLSLSSDQMSKVDSMHDKCVLAFQLDSIKQSSMRKDLIQFFDNIENYITDFAVFLFASPEAILDPTWNSMISDLLKKRHIRNVCIDEVHLFVHFALSFRIQFLHCKNALFEKLLLSNAEGQEDTSRTYTSVPVMFMTASFNKQLFNILEKITGYNFDKRNIFWSERKQFERRNISIDLTVCPQLIKYCKESLHNVLSTNNFKKAIMYSNSAKSIKIIQEKIDLWLDGNETNINGDTMMINGDIDAEQKFVNAKLFTKNLRDVSNNELNDLIYCPRILCAMSACIGAGLDLLQVYLAFCDGLPPSIIDFAQEMGRCGRRPLSTINLGNDRNNDDMFYLVITIESYCYMLLRIYDTSDMLSDCEAKLLERIISLDD